jgi:solute:Na+ symporter, SSS family
MVLPMLATGKMPLWIGVLVMIGVVGASVSTANGTILVTSAVVARNIIQRWSKVEMNDNRLLIYTRLASIPMTLFGGYFAYVRPEPGILLALAFDIVFAGCVVPLFFGVYWPKANATGAMVSVVVGTTARVMCAYLVPESMAGLDTLLPPLISLLVFVPACLLTDGKEPNRHHVISEHAPAFAAEAALGTEGD